MLPTGTVERVSGFTNPFLSPAPYTATDTTDNRYQPAVTTRYACRFHGFRRGA